jgi:hypothetical protein
MDFDSQSMKKDKSWKNNFFVSTKLVTWEDPALLLNKILYEKSTADKPMLN